MQNVEKCSLNDLRWIHVSVYVCVPLLYVCALYVCCVCTRTYACPGRIFMNLLKSSFQILNDL